MNKHKTPRVLIIAGSDSSGGAGIQADIKTLTVFKVFSMTAITAITAQNTNGVSSVESVSLDLIKKQIEDCGIDLGEKITILNPQSYLEFLHLMRDSKVVFTDSGGIQEESTVLKIPLESIGFRLKIRIARDCSF